MGRLKKPPALPYAALHHPPWDYGIVFASLWDTAVALGGGRSFYSCTLPLRLAFWKRGLQCCLYLIGPPEDSLRLRLRPSLVLGRTHPCSRGVVSHAGRLWCGSCTGGVVVVIIAYRGSPSSSNIRPSWAEPDINHLYTHNNAEPGEEEGPGSRQVISSHAWNWGPQELAYGYVWAASTSVDSPEAGISLKSLSRCGDGVAPVDSP